MDWTDRIGRRINPRDLHIFMTVIEQGAMAKAASRLAISRPVVSKAIADLERTLGVPLLDRSAHGVTATLYGRALLTRGVAVFDELKQSVRDIEYLADPTCGELTIGCTETVAATLPPLMEKFCRQYPRVALRVDQLARTRTTELQTLRDRTCDLVLGHFKAPILDGPLIDDLKFEILFDDRLVVTAGTNSRWARRRKIDLAELTEEPWILAPPPDNWNHTVLSEAFRARGLSLPKINLTTLSVHLRTNIVASGHFLTTFPASLMRVHASRFSLAVLPVDLGDEPRSVAIVTLKNRTLSPVVERFIECARETGKAHSTSSKRLRGG